MLNRPQRKQRRVDIACGYALGAYIGVTLTWVSFLLGTGFAFFALLIAAVAGLFGTLRTIVGMPMRFWMIPLASLIYTKAALIASGFAVIFVVVGIGIVYSAAFVYPLYRILKHDFAKSIPPWLCKACGYPLLGLTEPSCPECGKLFDPMNVPKIAEVPQQEGDRLQ